MWLPTFLQRGIHFSGERTEVLAFNNFVLFDRVHLPMIGKRAAAVEEDYCPTTQLHGSNGLRAIGVSGFTRPQSPLMNTVRFILPSDKDEDACRQRQYACNNSRDGKSGDCREADHDQINGKQEHSDVFGEDEVH